MPGQFVKSEPGRPPTFNRREGKMWHELFVKRRILLLYDEGKILEIRTRDEYTTPIKKGDTLILGGSITRVVRAIRPYPNFAAMGSRENPEHIWPGATMEEILIVLREIYPPEKERRGVLVFELPP